MSNLHEDLDEANKHTPKGFNLVGNNTRPWKDELDESTYTENNELPRAINFVDGTAVAPSNAQGDIYVLTGSGVIDPSWGTLVTFQDWVRADANNNFNPITPVKGMLCYDNTASTWMEFDGSVWATFGGGATNLSEGTVTNTTVDVNSDTGTNATLQEASTLRAGVMSKAKFDEVEVNNLKVSNVTTNLSSSTTATQVNVESSDGTDTTLSGATGSQAGILTAAKFDEIGVNNAKVSNATHTSEVTGSTALTVAPIAVSNKPLITATGTMELLVNDSGTLKKVVASDFLGGGSNLYTADGTISVFRTVNIGASGSFNILGANTSVSKIAIRNLGNTIDRFSVGLTSVENVEIKTGSSRLELRPFLGTQIYGGGTTSGSSALKVLNNVGTNLFEIKDDGTITGNTPNMYNSDGTISVFRTINVASGGSFNILGANTTASKIAIRNLGNTIDRFSVGLTSIENVELKTGSCRLEVRPFLGTRFYGQDTASGSVPLLVENSAAQKIFELRNNNAIGLYGATPVVQATTGVASSIVTPGVGTTVKQDDLFDGYKIDQVVKALRNLGILA